MLDTEQTTVLRTRAAGAGAAPRRTAGPAEDPIGAERTPPDAGADLLELIGVLRRNRRLIIGVLAFALTAALLYLAVAPRLYTATVSILFDALPHAPVASDSALTPPSEPGATLVESQLKLITSESVLRRVVTAEHLSTDPEFGPKPGGFSLRLLSKPDVSPGPMSATERAISNLAHAMKVVRSERTYVIDVSVSAHAPAKAARLANAVARAYFEDQQAARRELANRNSTWLAQRLADLQNRVVTAEAKVTRFKAAHHINEANGKNVAEQELGDLATQLVQARGRTAAARARANEIRRILASGRVPDGTSDALRSSTLDRLRGKYADLIQQETDARMTFGARHPALLTLEAQARGVQRVIAQELRRISEATQSDYEIARADESDLAAKLDAARTSEEQRSQSLAELSDLQRDADAARTIYAQFLRARETVAGEVSPGPSGRVIAAAAPPLAPSSPKLMLVLAMATAVGLFFGAAAALARDLFPSRRPTTPAPIDDRMVAAIPRIGDGHRGFLGRAKSWAMKTRAQELARDTTADDRRLREVERRPSSQFSAAISHLWTSLAPPRGESGNRHLWTVLVSSLSPGVGKTTIAANLARRAALDGARVLLIEVNAKNPQLCRLIEDVEPGLIDLSGTDRVIYQANLAGKGSLHFVPMMSAEARIVRRLKARGEAIRFAGIAGHFDVVIIDGPSAGNFEELRDLAATADRMAFAIRADERDEVGEFIDEFQFSSWRRRGAGLLAIVEDFSEAA